MTGLLTIFHLLVGIELILVDHALICKRGLFITEHHNELRDLEGDLLNLVYVMLLKSSLFSRIFPIGTT